MAYPSFRQFLDALEQAGELKRIAIPVDTELLVAEWAESRDEIARRRQSTIVRASDRRWKAIQISGCY